jgi:hypothetical protein
MSVKKPLTNEGDDKVTIEAIELHRRMVAKESRGSGDTDNAMRRLEATYGLEYWAQWICRYRREATPEFAHKVHGAWRAMLERSVVNDLDTLGDMDMRDAAHVDPELQSLVAEAKSLLAQIKAKMEGLK